MSAKEQFLQEVYEDTAEIAEECHPRDVAEVPSECDFFESHSYYACSGTDYKDAATDASAVAKKLPESAVDNKVGGIASSSGITPATIGTLSTIDDMTPRIMSIMYALCRCVSSTLANHDRMPHACRTATAIRMPRKNRMEGMSTRLTTFGNLSSLVGWSIL